MTDPKPTDYGKRRKANKIVLSVVGGVAALIVVSVLIDGATGDNPRPPTASSPAAAPNTTTSNAPTVAEEIIADPGAVRARCETAPAVVSDTIDMFMIDPDHSVGDVFQTTEGDLVYYGANIIDSTGQRVSSSDVWVAARGPAGDLSALSGSANEYTSMTDGRDLYGVSAGDPAGQLVEHCVQADTRIANSN